jgi:hypothetical protein
MKLVQNFMKTGGLVQHIWRHTIAYVHKRRKRRFRQSASIFRLIWISIIHNDLKRVCNIRAWFRCVFRSTDGTLKVRRILYAGHKSDAGVRSARRRRFLGSYGFRFSTVFWDVFVIETRDSIVFSVVQKVFSKFHVHCAYNCAHSYSHSNYMKPSCILPYPTLSSARFGWV